MSHERTTATGGNRGGNGTTGELSASSIPQKPAHLNPLLEKASDRMTTDRANYGAHFLIWLSLNAAANGIPWGAE